MKARTVGIGDKSLAIANDSAGINIIPDDRTCFEGVTLSTHATVLSASVNADGRGADVLGCVVGVTMLVFIVIWAEGLGALDLGIGWARGGAPALALALALGWAGGGALDVGWRCWEVSS